MKFQRKTIFSDDRRFRYCLWREFPQNPALDGMGVASTGNESRYVQFIGLNPSTANETDDYPTIRRCVSFAKSWGFGAMCMTNLFPFVTPYPDELYPDGLDSPDTIENDELLFSCGSMAGRIICCWGNFPVAYKTGRALVSEMLGQNWPVYHLGLNINGSPKHPLYLPKTTPAQKWLEE